VCSLYSVDEIAELRQRIIDVEEARDLEKASYEQQLQQLTSECKENKDNLIADNMMKGEATKMLASMLASTMDFC